MTFVHLIWMLIEIVFFVTYLIAIFYIVFDVFADRKLHGGWKALWLIFLIFVPLLTALVYLIVRGGGMAERLQSRRGTVAEDDSYRPQRAADPTTEIARGQKLLDEGVISQGEFEALKNKALTGRY